jgi:hypothetical protein
MTKSDEKLITFVDILYASARSCRTWLSNPNPESKNLRFHYPRIVSNTLFDNTSAFDFCVQKVYHTEGKFRRREEGKRLIEELKPKIKEKKKSIRHDSFKYHKGKYDAMVALEKILLEDYESQFEFYKDHLSKIGLIPFMVEHSRGREQSATCLLEYILQNNLENLDIKTEMDPLKIEGILKQTRELLKRFSFTIWLEKCGTLHTQANEELEAVQRGDCTWENYQGIISKIGYEGLSQDIKPHFENAKIELKYFKK